LSHVVTVPLSKWIDDDWWWLKLIDDDWSWLKLIKVDWWSFCYRCSTTLLPIACFSDGAPSIVVATPSLTGCWRSQNLFEAGLWFPKADHVCEIRNENWSNTLSNYLYYLCMNGLV
jgi:hypothetical protein